MRVGHRALAIGRMARVRIANPFGGVRIPGWPFMNDSPAVQRLRERFAQVFPTGGESDWLFFKSECVDVALRHKMPWIDVGHFALDVAVSPLGRGQVPGGVPLPSEN